MKRLMFFAVLLFVTGVAVSQNNRETLNQKWDKMLNKAETFQLYKVIKISEMNDVWKAVKDTVTGLKSELVQERELIAQQRKQIGELQLQVGDVNGSLARVKSERDNMSFIGMEVNKYSYNTALWVLILIVASGTAILFFLYRNSNKVTVQKIKDYEDLSTRFEEYKQSKIEMERKLKRELQTHMNRIEELKRA